MLDEGKLPVRNSQGFTYEFEGKSHRYFPDFLLEGQYIEIKGQKGSRWDSKVSQWNQKESLIIIDNSLIKPYIKYAEEKFGKEFWLTAYGDTFHQRITRPGA
jgi:hypothetical protein